MKTKILVFVLALVIVIGICGALFLMFLYPEIVYVVLGYCATMFGYMLYQVIYKKLTNKNQ